MDYIYSFIIFQFQLTLTLSTKYKNQWINSVHILIIIKYMDYLVMVVKLGIFILYLFLVFIFVVKIKNYLQQKFILLVHQKQNLSKEKYNF